MRQRGLIILVWFIFLQTVDNTPETENTPGYGGYPIVTIEPVTEDAFIEVGL